MGANRDGDDAAEDAGRDHREAERCPEAVAGQEKEQVERGKLKDGREPERVEGQYNIYDSVPGMPGYVWRDGRIVKKDSYWKIVDKPA